jgi:hypothetical protein
LTEKKRIHPNKSGNRPTDQGGERGRKRKKGEKCITNDRLVNCCTATKLKIIRKSDKNMIPLKYPKASFHVKISVKYA